MTTLRNNPDIAAGREQLRQVLEASTSIKNEKSALIGNSSTGDIFVDGSNETQVYIHGFGADASGVGIIAASGIPKKIITYGQPILIRKTPGGIYAFSRVDADADNIYSQGLSETPTQEPVYINQIRWGTMHPVGSSLSVLVVGASYGGTWIGDIVTAAFDGTAQDTSASSISVPTTNNRQIGVLVQMDATNKVLEYKQSTEYNASISKEAALNAGYLPVIDSGRYHVGYVFLKKGATALTYSDMWSLPDFINKGSGNGYFPLEVDTDIVVDTNEQVVVSGFSITTGSLTINGRVTIL